MGSAMQKADGVDAGVGERHAQHSSPDSSPDVTFFRFVPECRLPIRADRAAAGTMPTRAFRHCEAMTSASAFGWYVFPPITFSLMWDGGSDIFWTFKSQDAWFPLRKVQFPVQIWSGLIARTAPEWSLLIRSPVNLAHSQGYEHYEGIIETDRWFGPLFTNVRLTRTNVPVEFNEEYPFLQVQPVHRSTYGNALDRFEVVPELGQLRPADWEAFRTTVVKPNVDPHRMRGQYAVTSRRRRKQTIPAD
jgi:hypothetical protein